MAHRKVCWYYKQGKCSYGSRCHNLHLDSNMPALTHRYVPTPRAPSHPSREYIGYVPIPRDLPVGLVVGKNGNNIRRIVKALELRVPLQPSDRETREIKVIAADQEQYLEVKRKLEHLFAHFYSLAPIWTYLHRDGISVLCSTQFKFSRYDGRLLKHYSTNSPEDFYVLQLENGKPKGHDAAAKGPYVPLHLDANGFGIAQNPEHKFEKSLCVISDYGEIVKKLQEGLEWTRANMKDTQEEKLEARFGRKIWSNVPADYISEGLSLHDLEDFFYSNPNYRCSLNTSVESPSVDLLQTLSDEADDASHTVETYHLGTTFDVTVDGGGGREKKNKLDVRIMLTTGGKAKILGINKGADRVAIFDILCPQRHHDIRLELGLQETVHRGDPCFGVIQEMVRMVSAEAPGKLSFVPYTDQWTVHSIRHKKKTTYILEDLYMATISHITEIGVNERCRLYELQTVDLNEIKSGHWEVELCSTQWEPEYQKEAGMSTLGALCQYLEHPFAEDHSMQRAPQPTTVQEKDLKEMFEQLDMINSLLG